MCSAGKTYDANTVHADLVSTGIAESDSCFDCKTDYYYHLNTNSGVGECLQCHGSSTTTQPGALDVTHCKCLPGYGYDSADPSGPTCEYSEACNAGYFKVSLENVACVACANNEYQPVSASTDCLSCPAFSAIVEYLMPVGTDVEDCFCNAGYTGPAGGPCTPCVNGTFEEIRGSEACAHCGDNAYFLIGGSKTLDNCRSCQTDSTALQNAYGIADCICDAGYQRTDVDKCVACPPGSYCPQQHIIYTCPEHSTSLPASVALQDCTCVPGFYGSHGNCTVCPANAYCHANVLTPTYCMPNATTLGLNNRSNVSACICNEGFYEHNGYCVYCERDSYCFADVLTQCPSNASTSRGSSEVSDCVCDPGLQMYMAAGEPSTCIQCPSSQVCHSGGVVEYCRSGTASVNYRCACGAGFYCANGVDTYNGLLSCSGDAAACVGCPPDHYCNDNSLTPCAEHETAPVLSSHVSFCKCVRGYYRNQTGVCTICPFHYYCPGDESKISVLLFDVNLQTLSTGTESLHEAVCVEGFFRTSKHDLCKPCPKNFYCPLEISTGSPNVIACPENEFTLDTQASSKMECICLAGFKLTAHEDTMKCLPCDIGERCQAGQVVEAACHVQNKIPNADHTKCVCHIGFGLYDFQCQQVLLGQ